MSFSLLVSLNANRGYMSMGVTRQDYDDDGACFMASLSTLLDIDYELLPRSHTYAPLFYVDRRNAKAWPIRNGGFVPGFRSGPTIDDWNKAIEHTGKYLKHNEKWPAGRVSIINMIDLTKMDGHACIVDQQGYLCDNTVDSAFMGVHQSEVESSCNIVVASYFTAEDIE